MARAQENPPERGAGLAVPDDAPVLVRQAEPAADDVADLRLEGLAPTADELVATAESEADDASDGEDDDVSDDSDDSDDAVVAGTRDAVEAADEPARQDAEADDSEDDEDDEDDEDEAQAAEDAGASHEPATVTDAPAALSAPPTAVAADTPANTDATPVELLAAAQVLRDEVAALDFSLSVPSLDKGRKARESILGQMDDYLLPRLRRLDAPLLTVVGGSTGAGKSTLVNSLVGRLVSRSGVLRPTTRSPVLVHHPADAGSFMSTRILPGLGRVTSEAPEPMQPVDPDAPRITAIRLVPDPTIVPGLAVVDAPDIDSVVETNRDLAVQLLAAADLWLFVTTAARYVDATPWQMLREAVERGVCVAVVLDRVPPEAMQEVRLHLARLMRERGLANSPVFTVPEVELEDGLLPQAHVEPLLAWLNRLARDARTQAVVVNRTLAGAIESLPARVTALAAAADDQAAADIYLRGALEGAWGAVHGGIAASFADGSLLTGEVLARVRDAMGRGDLLALLGVTAPPRQRKSRVRSSAAAMAVLRDALCAGVEALVRSRAQLALDDALSRWRAHGAGLSLLAGRDDLAALSESFADRTATAVGGWQDWVMRSAADEPNLVTGGGLNAAEEALATTLMTLTLAPDTPVTQGETVDPLVLLRRVLQARLGVVPLQEFVVASQRELQRQIDRVLDAERARTASLLGPVGQRVGRGDALRAAVREVEEAG
ncbi:MAG: dynamin family protein [Kineosporiaceae bacterium]